MKHGRAGIREALKKTWKEANKNYRETSRRTGLSTGTLHRLIKQPNYWPKSPMVKNAIRRYGKTKGIVVGKRPLPK